MEDSKNHQLLAAAASALAAIMDADPHPDLWLHSRGWAEKLCEDGVSRFRKGGGLRDLRQAVAEEAAHVLWDLQRELGCGVNLRSVSK